MLACRSRPLNPLFGCVDPTAIRAAPSCEGVRIATCTANYQPVGLLHLQSSVQLNRTLGIGRHHPNPSARYATGVKQIKRCVSESLRLLPAGN